MPKAGARLNTPAGVAFVLARLVEEHHNAQRVRAVRVEQDAGQWYAVATLADCTTARVLLTAGAALDTAEVLARLDRRY